MFLVREERGVGGISLLEWSAFIRQFRTRGKLGRVDFRKDVWGC